MEIKGICILYYCILAMRDDCNHSESHGAERYSSQQDVFFLETIKVDSFPCFLHLVKATNVH